MTPRDVDAILNELAGVRVALARLEERIEGHESHEVRIRKLEQWRSMLAGVLAVCLIELQIVGVVMALMARTH